MKSSQYKNKRILNIEEVLNGFNRLERINPHTSAGIPYLKGIASKGKLDYISFDHEKQLWHLTDKGNEMLKEVDDYENKAKQLIRSGFCWSALLKDELRTIEKVETGSTRAFIGCPLPFTIIFRKYFGCFIDFLHEFGPKVGFTTGINPESDEWDEMYTRLLSLSSKFLSYDIKQFDAKVVGN
jgi:hypothetical protein